MAAYEPKLAPDPKRTSWPPGIGFIVGNEGCERFSYYGMTALLAVYITGLYLNLRGLGEAAAENAATEAVHLFSAAVYLLPLLGAIFADRLLGKYRTILYLSLVYCLGHLALAVFEDPTYQVELLGKVYVDPLDGLYIGLALIALGSGGIKPCVSAHVGDQFGAGNWHLLQKVFNLFYFMINFGSAFATILIPAIQGDLIRIGADGSILADGVEGAVAYGYSGSVGWAFGIPGILMGIATFAFWLGRKRYVHVPAKPGGRLGLLDFVSGLFLVVGIFTPLFLYFAGISFAWWMWPLIIGALVLFYVFFSMRQRLEADDGFLAIVFHAFQAKLRGHRGPFFAPARERFGAVAVEGPVAVLKIASVMVMIAVFWGLFNQHGSTWTHQAKAMDRVFDLSLFSWLVTGAIIGVATLLAVGLSVSRRAKVRWTYAGIGLAIGLALGAIASWQVGAFEINERQMSAANPFMVMVFIPLSLHGIYPLMDRIGIKSQPLNRMTVGMFLAALSFIPVALCQEMLDAGEKVHLAWQLLPYVIITFAEVMVSITGLEFAYSQAPNRMKSVVMSLWLVTVAIGDLLVVGLTRMELERATFFWVFAALMAGAALIFGLRARSYVYRDFSQDEGLSESA